MPSAAPRPCPYPGCGVLVAAGGHCPRHKAQRQREADAHRQSSTARGYDGRWRKARATHLRKHPLCEAHLARGQLVEETYVDHVVPHSGDRALFWDSANWQSLCKPCHSQKTAREDGGFGNRGSRVDRESPG